MIPVLRPYQVDGVEGIRDAFRNRIKRVVYVLPTGGGKTVIFSHIAHAAARKGTRILILTHRQEIADQIGDALDAMGVPHGMIRPHEEPQWQHGVQVGMIQTVGRTARLTQIAAHWGKPGLIIIDECHHAVAKTWADTIEALGSPHVLGVTATPERLDGRGLKGQFDGIVEGPDVRWLIGQGFLAPYRYLMPGSQANLSGLRKVAGDYVMGEAAEALDTSAIHGDIIRTFRQRMADGVDANGEPRYRSAIAFCCTVAHAQHVAAAFNAAGIPAASIDGGMAREDRRAVVEALRSGAITVLTSCEVISEGFDAPSVGGAILLRPTASFAMFRQQIGRCLRVKPDGGEAVILDHVNNVVRHGLPDAPHAWSLDGADRKRKAPALEVDEDTHEVREGKPREIRHVDGMMVDLMDDSWLAGLTIEQARDRSFPLWKLLKLAGRDRQRLRQIQLLRGYHRLWVDRKLAEMAEEARVLARGGENAVRALRQQRAEYWRERRT